MELLNLSLLGIISVITLGASFVSIILIVRLSKRVNFANIENQINNLTETFSAAISKFHKEIYDFHLTNQQKYQNKLQPDKSQPKI